MSLSLMPKRSAGSATIRRKLRSASLIISFELAATRVQPWLKGLVRLTRGLPASLGR
jgi:hypothetical protein